MLQTSPLPVVQEAPFAPVLDRGPRDGRGRRLGSVDLLQVVQDGHHRRAGPRSGGQAAGLRPLTKAQVPQLTKIAHRIVGAIAPDDRGDGAAGNEPA